MEKIKSTPNQFVSLKTQAGVPLYVMPLPYHETVAVGVLVRAGTRDEDWPREAGLAHALEHMFFQGTKRFPSSRDLAAHLEQVGGIVNAWTWTEMTFFWRSVPAAHQERAWETLSEQLRYPTFPVEKIPVEMKNIVQEIRRAEDDPKSFISRKASALFYGNHPLGRDTLGTEGSVSALTRSDFKKFWQRFYQPANYVFVVAGKISPEAALALFDKYFPEPVSGQANLAQAQTFEPPKAEERRFGREIEQVHLMLTWPGTPAGHPDYLPLKLFQTMISGGMSFPLFQEVRDKRGLCYEVWAKLTPWSDAGSFSVYVGTDPDRYPQAVDAVKAVIAAATKNSKLFATAKTTSIGRLALNYESPTDIINLAAQDIAGRESPRGYAQAVAEVESVSFKAVEAAVAKYLQPAQNRLTMLAPHRLVDKKKA